MTRTSRNGCTANGTSGRRGLFGTSLGGKFRLCGVVAGALLASTSCSLLSSGDDGEEPDSLAFDISAGSTIELESQFFESGSADLSEEGTAYLRSASVLIMTTFDSGSYVGPICIEGHTDSRGTEESNLALSQQRADNIMATMIGDGVQNEIATIGKGESEADQVETNLEARRVDIRLASCESI